MPIIFLNCEEKMRVESQIGSTRQGGVALVVVLIFIVALTSLAIYSARDVSLSERVARNQLDVQIAREAAEAALRDAEVELLYATPDLRTGAKCARGLDTRPVIDNFTFFKNNCANGQCNLDIALYSTFNYNTASTTTLAKIAARTIDGEPWWPEAKGGQWNDDLTTKPTTVGVNCTFTGGVPFGTYTGRAAITGVWRQPEYLIEYFPMTDDNLFRISARGFGRNPNTEIVLQSYFRPFQ